MLRNFAKITFRDVLITLGILLLASFVCFALQGISESDTHVPLIFVLAIFLISLKTQGYLLGIFASIGAVFGVNFMFTFPYFEFNFTLMGYPLTFFSMLAVSFSTSTLTSQVKEHEQIKLETEREKMRANLLRAISHDLRTPLTTIYGSSAALRENSDSLTPEQKDSMLRGIESDAQWLVRMVENLLSITRMDHGNVRIATVPTAVDELLDAVLIKFHKRYPNQNVLLDLPEDPVLISMDSMLMEQVLINLLENAVQHAVGMRYILLRITLGEGVACFEVLDDGCGIPTERLPYLFSGYYLPGEVIADNTKRHAGIGLSLCATIIRAHGSQITAENRPEGGAVFRFTMRTEEMTEEE